MGPRSTPSSFCALFMGRDPIFSMNHMKKSDIAMPIKSQGFMTPTVIITVKVRKTPCEMKIRKGGITKSITD